MFVLKQKFPANNSRSYLRRADFLDDNAQADTYISVGIADATRFDELHELFQWMAARGKKNMPTFPAVSIVEVRAVPNPQYEEVRVVI